MSRTWKRIAAPAAALTAAALLAACSSSSSSSSTTSPSSTSPSTSSSASTPSSPSASTSSGVTAAQAIVTKLEAEPGHPVPTASIKGVSALKGKTVYYVPLIQQVSGFILTAAAMKVALAKVGLKLQVCNGEATPSAVAACITQATGAGAAGIVLDSIPLGMAANAVTAANGKGIPVIVSDQLPPAGVKSTDKLAYVSGAPTQPNDIAYWMIANSGGKANAILAENADSPSSIAYVTNSQAIYKQDCPSCTITVKQISEAAQAQMASATSSYLLADPNATYYYTEFEDSLAPALQAIQTSHRSSISLSVAGGSTFGLGALASGSGPVKAVVAVDQTYAGWALTDQILRMATKTAPLADIIYPTRLFTKDNIGSVKVTPAAEGSGAWFGSSAYQADFQKLWGA